MKTLTLIALGILSTAQIALANPAQPEDMDRIKTLSQTIATATAELYERAETSRHNFTAREEQALRRLADLEFSARAFRRFVQTHPNDPDFGRNDFDDVVAAYTRASSALTDLHAYPTVADDFSAVERAVTELTDIYGGQHRYWGRHQSGDQPTVTIPASTSVGVTIRTGLRSRDLNVGDVVMASLADDLLVHGRTLAKRGTDVQIQVTDVQRAGRVKGKERVTFELEAVRIGRRMQTLESHPVTFEADGTGGKDARTIVGSTVAGAILGVITSSDNSEGATKGAVVGAAAGTGVVLATRGKSVRLEPGARIDFRLARAVHLRVPVSTPRIQDTNDVSQRR